MSNSQEFDIHNPASILMKMALLRQKMREIDDELTGLMYVTVLQVRKDAEEQKKAETKPLNLL